MGVSQGIQSGRESRCPQQLDLMGNDGVCVCFFVEILGESQPKISRHLAHSHRAAIVAARREGKWMHYRITDPPNPHAARVLSEVRACLVEDKEMQREPSRFINVLCTRSSYSTSQCADSGTLLNRLLMTNPKRILFVCVGNSNRSQMAEAFA